MKPRLAAPWVILLLALAGCSTVHSLFLGGPPSRATLEKKWSFEEFGRLLATQWSEEARGRFEVYPVPKEEWQKFLAQHQVGDEVWVLSEGTRQRIDYYCLVRNGKIIRFFKYEIGDIAKAAGG